MRKYSEYQINEKISINKKNKVDKSILFTDIVGSSNNWNKTETLMAKALEELSTMVDNIVEKHKGIVIKTIGDAYMVSFDTLSDSIKAGIEIQKTLKSDKIKVDKNYIKMRLGICFGPVYETEVNIQHHDLVDYLGNTVNTSSRIESKVCEEGDIAFGALSNDIDRSKIDDILEDYKVELITFNNKGDEVKRSSRVLTDIQRHIYKNIEELKGVDKIDVYKVKI